MVAEIAKAGGVAVASYDSVADFDAAANIINSCVSNFGRIDILVNWAGIGGFEEETKTPVQAGFRDSERRKSEL